MSGTIPAAAKIVWAGEHRFDASAPGSATIRIDASGKTGTSPVTTLLAAIGGCVSVDVVDILAKRKTPVESLEIDLQATELTVLPNVSRAPHSILISRGSGSNECTRSALLIWRSTSIAQSAIRYGRISPWSGP